MFAICSVMTWMWVSVSALTQPSLVTWEADYGKALEATRSDDRPLLVVLDVPAESVVEDLAAEDEPGKLLGSYQLCHIDVSTQYGQKVAEVFQAEQFPFAAIIDKTGSVVLCKKTGPLSSTEWEKLLSTYQKGESATHHTSAYRGGNLFGGDLSSTTVKSPGYCPSCQLKAKKNSAGSL